jgi:hypothetical protein
MSESSNVWLGNSSINFSNVHERVQVQVASVIDYLSNIEYVVDIHATKKSLGNMLSNVCITFARDSFDDFPMVLPDNTTTDLSNVFTFQLATDTSFNINSGGESISRMPTNLRGNYITNVNAGADKIVLASGRYPTINNNLSNSLPVQYNSDGSVALSSSAMVTMNKVSDTEYNNFNLAMTAIPKAISSQMQGFAGDENLLRLVSKPAHYFNMMTFTAQGSIDNDNNVVSLSDVLSGTNEVQSNNYNVYSLLTNEITTDRNITQTPVGHYIMAHIFNLHPPTNETIDVSDNNSELLWAAGDGDSADGNDYIYLNNTAAVSTTFNLQYVLKTRMSLLSRNNTLLNGTSRSPDMDEYASEGEVHILYNIIFDRDEDNASTKTTTITAAAGGSISTSEEMNFTSISIPANALSTDTDITLSKVEDTSNLSATSSSMQLTVSGQTQSALVDEYLSPVIELKPHGTTFSSNVTVEIPFNASGLADGQTVLILKMDDTSSTGWTVIGQHVYVAGEDPIAKISLNSFSVVAAASYSVTGSPPAPENFSNALASYDRVDLSWSAASGASSYTISTSPETTNVDTSSSSYTLTGLDANETYTVTIESFNSSGVGGNTASVTISTPPDSVTGFSNALASSDEVDLSWTAATGASDYKIVSVPATTTQTATGTSHTFTGLSNGTVYDFTITSRDGDHEGNSATLEDVKTAIGGVTNFANAVATHQSVDLSWTAASGATSYSIVSNPATTTQTSTGTSHSFTGLDADTTYSFTITSYDGSQAGESVTVSGVETAPAAVTDLSNVLATYEEVDLSWTGAAGATSYTIVSSPATTTQTATGTSHTFTGLDANETYSFTVTANNGEQAGGSASISGINTAPGAVTGFSNALATHEAVELSWTGAAGADEYSIISSPHTSIQTSTGTSHTFTGLDANTTYSFTITSKNGVHSGDTASVLGVKTAPAAATGLSNALATHEAVDLSWTVASGATSYTVVSSPATTTQTSTGATHTFTGLDANTTYSFTVTSNNGDQVGDSVTVTGVVTAPAAVAGFANALATHQSVDLSWTAASGATEYSIVSSPATTTQTSTGSAHTFTGLDANTTYSFTITSKNGAQSGDSSSVSGVLTAPAAVSGLSETTMSYNSAQLSWTASTGATRYEIVSSPATTTQTSTGSTHTFTGLDANTLYDFTVTAYNGDQVGDVATLSSKRTAPGSVTGLSNALATFEAVDLSWTAAAGADGYSIVSSPATTTQTSTGTSHTFTGLGANTTYSFTVTSKNGELVGNSATVTGVDTAPGAVANFANALAAYNSVDLSWTAAAGATRYEIVSSPATTTKASTGTSLTFTGLDANTTYSFTITPFDGDHAGETATVSGVLTAPERVTNLSNAAPTSTSVTLSWTAADGADEYYIVSGETTETTTESSYTFNGLSSGTSHSFEVISYNGEQEGNSDSISVTTATAGAAAVTNFTASHKEYSFGKVNLSWTAASGADSYTITNGTTSFDTTGTSYEYTGLSSDTTYTFTITSKTGSVSGGSTSSSITTYERVGNLSNTLATYNSVQVDWDAVSRADNLVVSYKLNDTGSYVSAEITGTASTYTFTGLESNQDYRLRVMTKYNDTGNGGVNALYPVYTAPNRVTGLSATSIQETQITLGWTEPTNSSGVTYYVTAPGVTTKSTTGSSVTMTGLTTSTEYTFTVTPQNGDHVGRTETVTVSTSAGYNTHYKFVFPDIGSETRVKHIAFYDSSGNIVTATQAAVYPTDSSDWKNGNVPTSTSGVAVDNGEGWHLPDSEHYYILEPDSPEDVVRYDLKMVDHQNRQPLKWYVYAATSANGPWTNMVARCPDNENGYFLRGLTASQTGGPTGLRWHTNNATAPIWVDSQIRPVARESSSNAKYVGYVFSNGRTGAVGGDEFSLV